MADDNYLRTAALLLRYFYLPSSRADVASLYLVKLKSRLRFVNIASHRPRTPASLAAFNSYFDRAEWLARHTYESI